MTSYIQAVEELAERHAARDKALANALKMCGDRLEWLRNHLASMRSMNAEPAIIQGLDQQIAEAEKELDMFKSI